MDSTNEGNEFGFMDYDQTRLVALNSSSLNDFQWIGSEVIEGYQLYLTTVYKKELKENNFVFLPWYLCFKVDPAHLASDAGQWRIHSEVIRGLELRGKKVVGVIGDGSHWVLYELCASELKARFYDSLRHKQEYNVTKEGIPILLLEIANFLGVPATAWKIEFVEPHIRQRDDYNCGISCMLEMKKLLLAKTFGTISNLDDFRVEIRRDLSKSRNEVLKMLKLKQNNANKSRTVEETVAHRNKSILQQPQSDLNLNKNSSINVSNKLERVCPKTSVMLNTFKHKFKHTISIYKVGVLIKDLVTKNNNDPSKAWTVNYRSLDDTTVDCNSYIGLLQSQSNFLVYHLYIRSQQGNLFDPFNYLRISCDAQEGLKTLLAEFNTLFGLPKTQWSLKNVASGLTDFDAGMSQIFENISELDKTLLGKHAKVKATTLFTNNQEMSVNVNGDQPTEEIKWTEPAKCGYCSAIFKQKKNLKSHNVLKHPSYPLLALPVNSDNTFKDFEMLDADLSVQSLNISSSNAKKRKFDAPAKTDSQSSVSRSYLEYKVEEIQNLISGILTTTTVRTDKKIRRDEFSLSCSRLLKETKSIDKILETFSWLKLTYSSDENRSKKMFQGLECERCNKERPGCGLFAYSYEHGSQFDKRQIPKATQPAAFCHLKENILDHVNTKTHRRVFNLPLVPDKVNQNEIVDSQHITKDFIDKMFASIATGILLLAPKPKPTVPTVKETNARSELETLISNSKCVKELLHNVPILTIFPAVAEDEEITDYNGFTCNHCYFGSRSGFFEYLCTNTDQKKFDRLKTNIKLHLKTKTHLKNHPEMICDSDKNIEVVKKNQEIGVLLGRLAYKAIVSNQSYKKFEAEVAFLSDAGVCVGDINHSHEFVSKLRPHFYQALKDHLKDILITPLGASSKPSPFTLYADKMSPYGTTFQIIGIITMIAGENKAIVLSIKPVYNHTAEAIAKDLVNTLNEFYPPDVAKTLLASQSYDGQYIRMGVPHEVIKQLKIPFDKKLPTKRRDHESWVTQSWDIMHLIELGVQDVEKLTDFKWVKTIQQTIVDINKSHQYGKSWNEFQECAEALDMQALRPGSFSTTRFAAYRFRVYRKFEKMFNVTYLQLSKDESSELNRINNAEFCLLLSALVDISTVLSIMSKSVQKSTSFCWESDIAVERGLNNLKAMSEAFDASVFASTCKNLVSFNDAVASLKKDGTYRMAPVYTQAQTAHNLRSQAHAVIPSDLDSLVSKVTKRLAKYVTAIQSCISKRFTKNHTQRGFVLARELFSRDEILSRPAGIVPETFFEYVQMAKDAGYIADIPEEQLDLEYSIFSDIIHTRFSHNEDGIFTPEATFYREILLSESILEECRNVAHLLLAALVRNKSEAIAESIGSTISNHLSHRCMLKNETLNEEIFLHHNSGQYNRACDWIVEKALKSYSEGKDSDLRFLRTSRKKKLKSVETSIVVDKIHSVTSLLPITKDYSVRK